jgi:Arc/MetJ family transcription regulator
MINLDAKALREAAEELGTRTREDTVNAALREIAGRYKYRELIARMQRGEFGHPDGMIGAWRD